ncbi:hypothetical protein J7E91_31265 [Streptomyces sp. ISL-99]|uniref:hypothetical protein n=1 Tax=Streptomyces sp. ISL-99 TaxID=2819193 RepID=UPI001BE5DB1D|nr:hypothetical protein [Streptomyces sp. ISL-99]MBT2529746.1 hypothetical protein [Streptomyces sp. ISL-99]
MKRTNSWPYAVTAIVVLAIQTDWGPKDVLPLAGTLLVLVGLILTVGGTPPR